MLSPISSRKSNKVKNQRTETNNKANKIKSNNFTKSKKVNQNFGGNN